MGTITISRHYHEVLIAIVPDSANSAVSPLSHSSRVHLFCDRIRLGVQQLYRNSAVERSEHSTGASSVQTTASDIKPQCTHLSKAPAAPDTEDALGSQDSNCSLVRRCTTGVPNQLQQDAGLQLHVSVTRVTLSLFPCSLLRSLILRCSEFLLHLSRNCEPGLGFRV